MKEKYLLDKSSEHFILLTSLFKMINDLDINNILDCGSGKTSLSNLLDYYKGANIDGITYYNDRRKIDSINANIRSKQLTLIEKDICKDDITKEYDLVLAHLLLGEALTWGNSYRNLLNKLFMIETKHLVIVDFKEDPSIDYQYLEKLCLDKGYKIVCRMEIPKKEPQEFKNFLGKNYIGYYIIK